MTNKWSKLHLNLYFMKKKVPLLELVRVRYVLAFPWRPCFQKYQIVMKSMSSQVHFFIKKYQYQYLEIKILCISISILILGKYTGQCSASKDLLPICATPNFQTFRHPGCVCDFKRFLTVSFFFICSSFTSSNFLYLINRVFIFEV